jgi:hypothetical protein
LRVLVKGGKIRAWLDTRKRINIADPGYTGGAVAIWSQGSTSASFSDWMADVYDGGTT